MRRPGIWPLVAQWRQRIAFWGRAIQRAPRLRAAFWWGTFGRSLTRDFRRRHLVERACMQRVAPHWLRPPTPARGRPLRRRSTRGGR